jgi:hypothetical protein
MFVSAEERRLAETWQVVPIGLVENLPRQWDDYRGENGKESCLSYNPGDCNRRRGTLVADGVKHNRVPQAGWRCGF